MCFLSVLAEFGGSRSGKRRSERGLCQFSQSLEEAVPESDTGNNYGLCQFWQSLEKAVPESDAWSVVFVNSGKVWRKPCRKAILGIRSLSILAEFGGSRAGKRCSERRL